jgi:hypothetical protein
MIYYEYLPNDSKRGVIGDIGGKMRPYIEIGNSFAHWRRELSGFDLRNIGEFTTENILKWLPTLRYNFEAVQDTSRVVEFHAVCGDKDIHWTTTEPWEPFDGVPVTYGVMRPFTPDEVYKMAHCTCGHARWAHRDNAGRCERQDLWKCECLQFIKWTPKESR